MSATHSSHELLLARARAAAGGAACTRVRTLRREGAIAAGGLSGRFEQCVDRVLGRSARTFSLGPATYATGYDGTHAWRRGPNGEVTRQDADASVRAAITQAWLDGHGWWSDESAAFELLGAQEADGCLHDVLRATPAGGSHTQLWFDARTHRLARIVQVGTLGRDDVTLCEDHRVVDGVWLPHRLRHVNGDPRFDRVVTLDRVVLDDPIAPHDLAAPTEDRDDLHLAQGADSARIAIEVRQNTIVVPVDVDGHALRFVLDTGGVTLLTAAAAARRGLRREGALEAGGMDGRKLDAGFTRVQRLRIGDAVVLERQLLPVLEMPGADDVLGVPVDGLIGADLLRRLVLRIDYERATLTFLPPTVPPGDDWGERLPLTFFAHIPCVEATLDGQNGQYLLDTGNSGAVMLHARADAPPLAATSAVTTVGWGPGGALVGRLARGTTLALGRSVLPRPVLRMLEDRQRALTAPGLHGNLGGAILSRFVVTFDASRGAVWLAPNTPLDAPFHADRSGLRIHADGDRFEVMAVMAGSPADECGLRAGDRIVAVDSVATSAIDLPALRRAWQVSDVGTRVALRVERNGAASDAQLSLRDLVPGA